ncbi:MAG: hypothetical protein CVV07_01825 [Gammaproteobacteria bacterium HGW-Gammaproteobacteria-11]|nr:MAG: hypothetical protein CVV07_01825 [Gammaproteobacteria bacterium HGW-Gammaproteobacteria-11]
MSESLVAQCPYCQTRFRLSHDHLQAAAGNVRCGACLKVFNADPEKKAQRASAQVSTRRPEPTSVVSKPIESTQLGQVARQGSLLIHDDLELDDLDLKDLGLDESILEEINPTARAAENLPAPAAIPSPSEAQSDLTSEPSALRFDLEEIAESGHPAEAREVDTEEKAEDDPFDLDSLYDPALEYPYVDADETEEEGDSPELELHEAFMSTPRADDFIPEPPKQTASDTSLRGQNTLFGAAIPEPMRPLIAPVRDHGIFLRDNRTGKSGRSAAPAISRQEPSLGRALSLPDINDELLLLDDERPLVRRPRHQWLWGLLSLLAALALIAQLLAYNFTALSHHQSTRPLAERICLLTGCELPARVDINLIRSSNLVVRPHPEFPNALAVDVILYNRADFAQPFPVLRMRFSDLNGRELASKQVRPEEYLAGELAGVTLMPPQVPVHVGLNMLDPGPSAAGYTLDFLSP